MTDAKLDALYELCLRLETGQQTLRTQILDAEDRIRKDITRVENKVDAFRGEINERVVRDECG